MVYFGTFSVTRPMTLMQKAARIGYEMTVQKSITPIKHGTMCATFPSKKLLINYFHLSYTFLSVQFPICLVSEVGFSIHICLYLIVHLSTMKSLTKVTA